MSVSSLEGFQVRPWTDDSRPFKDYCSRMSKPDSRVLYDSVVARELGPQAEGVEEAPRSIYDPDKLYEALGAFAPQPVVEYPIDLFKSEAYSHGVRLAYSCFAKPKDEQYLEPLPLTCDSVRRLTSNPGGSPGLTALGKKKRDVIEKGWLTALRTLRREKKKQPCLAFARTQFGGKTRLVWGYPYSMTILEGLLAYPLIQRFKGGSSPMAFAMSNLTLGAKLRVAAYNNRWAYSLDYSQFDSSVPDWLITKAFDIIKTWFDLDQVEPTSGMTYRNLFQTVRWYFINTAIVMPNGMMYIGKNHGVPSGSYFTQLVDSIVNTIVAGTISYEFRLRIDKHYLFVLGDDLLMWSNKLVSLDKIAQYVNKNFGMHLHGSEKSVITPHTAPVHFLGRIWTDGIPSLDVQSILQRALYPERFRRYSRESRRRRREAILLLLSLAETYLDAWIIVVKALHLDVNFRSQRYGPIHTLVFGDGAPEVDPDHLSGLVRYREKYINPRVPGKVPYVAIQIMR